MMDLLIKKESSREKEYIKKIKAKKLNKYQEFKTLNFAAGSSSVIFILLFLNGFDVINKEFNKSLILFSLVYFIEAFLLYTVMSTIRKQILNNGFIKPSTRRIGILLIAFIATGNIFAVIAGFTLIKRERTLEYTLSIYMIINSICIIMVTALNLFKESVVDTFTLGFGLIIAITILYIFSMLMISLYIKGSKIDKKLIPVAIFLLVTSLTGNAFALIISVMIITKYRHKDEDRSIEWINILERLFRNNMAIMGLLVVVFLLSLSILSCLTFDYSIAIDNNYSAILKQPSLEYPFGTDNFGRCVFTRIVFGTRISLVVGICVTIIPLIAGAALGAAAGYFGGRVDNIIMRVLDVQYAVPDILLAIAIIAAFGANTTNLILALSIGSVAIYARTVRATVLSLANAEFVEAARACGAKDHVIIFKHIIPNSLAPIIVRATMSIGTAVLATSSLSYLGLGVEPYIPEWGNVLKIGSKYLESNPYLAVFPGLAIIILVLAFNFFGDGLRDALDPKLK